MTVPDRVRFPFLKLVKHLSSRPLNKGPDVFLQPLAGRRSHVVDAAGHCQHLRLEQEPLLHPGLLAPEPMTQLGQILLVEPNGDSRLRLIGVRHRQAGLPHLPAHGKEHLRLIYIDEPSELVPAENGCADPAHRVASAPRQFARQSTRTTFARFHLARFDTRVDGGCSGHGVPTVGSDTADHVMQAGGGCHVQVFGLQQIVFLELGWVDLGHGAGRLNHVRGPPPALHEGGGLPDLGQANQFHDIRLHALPGQFLTHENGPHMAEVQAPRHAPVHNVEGIGERLPFRCQDRCRKSLSRRHGGPPYAGCQPCQQSDPTGDQQPTRRRPVHPKVDNVGAALQFPPVPTAGEQQSEADDCEQASLTSPHAWHAPFAPTLQRPEPGGGQSQ